jgi:hypothetical protein
MGLPPELACAVRASLHSNGERAAAPFIEAVTVQRARPLGADPRPPEAQREEDRDVAAAVLGLVRAATAAREPAGDGRQTMAESANRLRSDPSLLAAVFQNIDLLYRHGYSHADAVSEMVMRALATLPTGGGEPSVPVRRMDPDLRRTEPGDRPSRAGDTGDTLV